MTLFRRFEASVFRWRIARIDRRLDALQARLLELTDANVMREIGLRFDVMAIERAVLARRLGKLSEDAVPPPPVAPAKAVGDDTRVAAVEAGSGDGAR
jgi:hypothetical protein